MKRKWKFVCEHARGKCDLSGFERLDVLAENGRFAYMKSKMYICGGAATQPIVETNVDRQCAFLYAWMCVCVCDDDGGDHYDDGCPRNRIYTHAYIQKIIRKLSFFSASSLWWSQKALS